MEKFASGIRDKHPGYATLDSRSNPDPVPSEGPAPQACAACERAVMTGSLLYLKNMAMASGATFASTLAVNSASQDTT
jgi:hypothetical protein